MFKIGKVERAIVLSLELESEKWVFDRYHAIRKSKNSKDTIDIWIGNGIYGLELEEEPYSFNYMERRLIYKTIKSRIRILREVCLNKILKKFI